MKRFGLFFLSLLLGLCLVSCDQNNPSDVDNPVDIQPPAQTLDTAAVNVPLCARAVYHQTVGKADVYLLQNNWIHVQLSAIEMPDLQFSTADMKVYVKGQSYQLDSVTIYDEMLFLYSEHSDSVSMVLGLTFDTESKPGYQTFLAWESWVRKYSDLGQSVMKTWMGVIAYADKDKMRSYADGFLSGPNGKYTDFCHDAEDLLFSESGSDPYMIAASMYVGSPTATVLPGSSAATVSPMVIEVGFLPAPITNYSFTQVLVGDQSLLQNFGSFLPL